MKRLLLLGCLALLSVNAFAKTRLLLIESYDRNNPWATEYRKGIQSVLKGEYGLAQFNMDTKKFSQNQMPLQANLAWQVYRDVKPPLVFLGDDDALKYLGPRLENTTTPVVYLGITNDPDYYVATTNTTMTGFIERPLLKRSVKTINQIFPNKPRKILVLMDNSAQAKAVVRSAGSQRLTIDGTKTVLYRAKSWEDWQKRVKTAKGKGYDAIIIALSDALTNIYGNKVSFDRVLSWTSSNTTVPPFSFWSHAVGGKRAIGGVVLDGYAQGKAAATLAIRILNNGGKVDKTEARKEMSGKYVFSKKQLAKWQIHLPQSIKSKTTFIE